MAGFELVTDYRPQGDQPRAIGELVEGVHRGDAHQILLGVTGSGKTFTMANVMAHVQRPTLVIAHNKTLAAQLYGEFKELFPENAVEYFVSYYDYYQPEAYVPSLGHVHREGLVHQRRDRADAARGDALAAHPRRRAHRRLGLLHLRPGHRPEATWRWRATAVKGSELGRDAALRRLVDIQYERNDVDFHRGTFRVRGDTVEVFPAYEEERAIRIEFFGDTVERDHRVRPAARAVARPSWRRSSSSPPATTSPSAEQRARAIRDIRDELRERLHVASRARTSCSRRSASSSARCSTWR